ncbi:MAG TPA: FG-GAP-like repeat-containing protein [Gaiellaceae bacterium]
MPAPGAGLSAHAAPAPGDGLALRIRGRAYPVLLPKLRDPRLHLAATITSLQVIGQIGFHFQLSITQILISLGTCAVLEVAIAVRKQGVLLWPASALLTGNGVAFVLRVPGTAHGDWWTTRGWWIFAATAAGSLLSKHVLVWRKAHIFNPSNIGLVVCFLALGRTRAAPLDFWWGPMSGWLVAALVVILLGGFTILSRLKLLRVALGFWFAFAAAIAILAASGHAMTARWHLGPVTGFHFWAVLVTSPEVLVFLFFMITDPKTAPAGPRARIVYSVALGLLGALLIAPTTTEFAAKVALLSSLAIVCVAMPVLRLLPRLHPRRLALAAPVVVAAYVVALVFGTSTAPSVAAAAAVSAHDLPPIQIVHSSSVQSQLDQATARVIATALVTAVPAGGAGPIRIQLQPGTDQGPPLAQAQYGGTTYVLHQSGLSSWALNGGTRKATGPAGPTVRGYQLKNVAPAVGLDFRQGSFRYGMSPDYRAMMGGGVCWLDYNNDGWLDLFAVNSYASADTAQWQAHGGLPRSALFENVHGRFRNVSRATHADLAVQGDGCVAADLNGDGHTDLVVTSTSGVQILWNSGHGTFRTQSLARSGWYAGAAVADVNGDGRPDIFVAGYSDPNEPVPGSLAGFPTNIAAVRDLLYLNEGNGRFREVGQAAGLEPNGARHGLGAQFLDVNQDGRPDLYVANDEDPNELYVNVAWPGGAKADPAGLGFRFEDRGVAAGVADPFAGMGVASELVRDRFSLLVTNSRHEPTAAFSQLSGPSFENARAAVDPALGTAFAGWGASFVDLRNSGKRALVIATGAIPVTNLSRDAETLRVLGPSGPAAFANAAGAAPVLNGRGLAAADVDNDGRMEIAVNTIGGNLVLLRPAGAEGNWLDVKLSRFVPGTVITALAEPEPQTQVVQAGTSYLSSEDPRVHFGLGTASKVDELTVEYPWGAITTLKGLGVNKIVDVRVPPKPLLHALATQSPSVGGCSSTTQPQSLARLWDRTAVSVLRIGNATSPVQARDLLDVSLAMSRAQAAAGPTALDYAAYRLLIWRASFGTNLSRTFARLTAQMHALCLSPGFVSTKGTSPAAVGNRIAAAAIAAGRTDGSLEAEHYTDTSYTAPNAPLVVRQSGSTVHDATFWQPLSLGRTGQPFSDSQWGRVRTFTAGTLPAPGPPPFDSATTSAYRRAALGVIRATAPRTTRASGDASPLAWNLAADALPPVPLTEDLHRLVVLNGALNDAAVAVWRAKRAYQAPRPISMIRYLAFTGQLPLVPGLVELSHGQTLVRSRGRWVPGAQWAPLGSTPASPGWVSEQSTFAFAANEVLTALTGRSFEHDAERASSAALANGIETPVDDAAGRALGTAIGKRALAP